MGPQHPDLLEAPAPGIATCQSNPVNFTFYLRFGYDGIFILTSRQDGLECAFEIQKILTRNSNRGRFNSPQSVSMPTLPARQISSSQFLTAPTPVTASSGSTSPLVRPIPRQGSFDMFSLPTTFIASGPARSPSSSEEELSDDETPSRLVADLLLPERPELHFPAPMNRPNLGQSVRPRLGRSMTVFPPHEDESDAALSVTPPERTNNPLPRNSPFWDRASTITFCYAVY